ncbi:hypothetical protein CDIK_3565 [Cucumispora dikerogammari]|nr:hypothetical protein CDIK_3565 [Cucumispora dikerogammari]
MINKNTDSNKNPDSNKNTDSNKNPDPNPQTINNKNKNPQTINNKNPQTINNKNTNNDKIITHNKIKNLLRYTIRKFYNQSSAIIYDIILENIYISQQTIINLLKISYREFNKQILTLKNDKLILTESQIFETNTVLFYYINYLQSYNIIKYKMFKIYNNSNINISNNNSEVYKCLVCNKNYNILEIQSLIENFKFICCKKEVVLQLNVFDFSVYQLFLSDCDVLIKLLKELEDVDILNNDFLKSKQLKSEFDNLNNNNSNNNSSFDIISFDNNNMNNNSGLNNNNNTSLDLNNENIININNELSEENNEDINIINNNITNNNITNNNITDNNNITNNNNNDNITIVYVNGIPKNISLITDMDLEQMNETEYNLYFDLKENLL